MTDTEKIGLLIARAAKDGELQDVLDWDVFAVRQEEEGLADPEVWAGLKGKAIVVLSALFPETTASDQPDLAAGVYSLSPQDARELGRGLVAVAELLNPSGGN